jgi:hypothetical protein
MRTNSRKRLGAFRFALVCILCLIAASSPAQTLRFVQITDAHIFDAGKRCKGDLKQLEQEDNLQAIRWAIQETNEINWRNHVNPGIPKVSFLVFTGDFGLENVVDPALSRKPPSRADTPCKDGSQSDFKDPIASVDIQDATERFADLFAHLDKEIIIFLVPGNNDLIDENPDDIDRYTKFVELLQQRLPGRIYNLAKEDYSFSIQGHNLSLLGFNTASFKPTDAEKLMTLQSISGTEAKACDSDGTSWIGPACPLGAEPADEDFQSARENRKNARQDAFTALNTQIGHASGDYLIFTHVPDVRDPASDCNAKDTKPRVRYRSSWFLSTEQREAWTKTVGNLNLVAVFAGHFHSNDRDLYGLPKGPEPLPSEKITQKTYIAPPLAIKFQNGKQPTARGLLLVDLRLESSHWSVAKGNRPLSAPEAAIGRPLSIWYGDPISMAVLKSDIVDPLEPPVTSRQMAYLMTLVTLIFLLLVMSVVVAVWLGLKQWNRQKYSAGKYLHGAGE